MNSLLYCPEMKEGCEDFCFSAAVHYYKVLYSFIDLFVRNVICKIRQEFKGSSKTLQTANRQLLLVNTSAVASVG